MPIAIAVGRRVVLLVSTAILVISAVLCATAKSYEWHLAARMVLGLAAGQSESVVPMIVQVRLPFTEAGAFTDRQRKSTFFMSDQRR